MALGSRLAFKLRGAGRLRQVVLVRGLDEEALLDGYFRRAGVDLALKVRLVLAAAGVARF